MRYPPNFIGFLKALFDPFRGKKLRPRIPWDEHVRNPDDYDIYEPGKDPGMEFWRARAEELAERKEQEKFEAEERMIEDYEFRHKDDREDKNAADGPEAIVEKRSFVTREEGTTDLAEEDAAEDYDSSDGDDFNADSGTDFDGEF